MKWVKNLWPYIFIVLVVLTFFFPIFLGKTPIPGDLLVNINPYNAQGYLGYAPGGYPNKAQGMDVISEIYPWRSFSISQLKLGIIPFWNPYNFSGNPQMANFQTAIFYPFNLLYFILPFNLSWAIIIMLQPLLAAFFMYLYLKKGVGLKDFPSFIGAVSFAFCSYMVVWIEYGNIGSAMLWLPLALLFTKYFFNKLNTYNFLGLSITLSLAILAGYIQGVFYIYILCFLYYIYLALTTNGAFKNHRKNFLFLLSLLLSIIATSFQLVPTLQLFSQSTRGAYSLLQIEKNLAPFWYWITIVFPDFFGNPATRNYFVDGTYIERVMYPGIAIVFFAFYAIINKIDILEKRFFLIIGAVSLLIATNLPLIKYFYLIPIPVISTTIPTRELSIFIFCSVVIGSIGLNHFIEKKEIKIKTVSVFFSFIAAVWLIVFLLQKTSSSLSLNLKITERNLIIPTILTIILVVIFVLLWQRSKKLSYTFITLVVVFDLLFFFNKITPFSSSDLIYPITPVESYFQKNAGIERVWGYGSAYIPANFQSVHKIFSPEGNDPLHISRYGELLSSSATGEFPQSVPRPDANIAPGYGPDELKNNFFRKRILDLLGVKYILHKQELVDAWYQTDFTTFPSDQFTLVYKVYPWQIYQNKNALPRFFLTNNYIVAKNKKESLSLVYDNKIDLSKTLILEKQPSINIDLKATGDAKLISYNPNNILIKTKSNSNSLLFLSDNYYSDWSVKIDGKTSEIFLTDYAFRSVAVPKGSHIVEFFYNPQKFMIAVVVSIIGILLIVITSVYVNIKKNDENPRS